MKIEKTKETRKNSIDFSNLGFGKYFSDHMLIMDYKKSGWEEAKILPYQPINLEPANITLHYGQCIFEGQKAFKGSDGKVRLFRLDSHYKRLINSSKRMFIPETPEEPYKEAFIKLIDIDRDFIPSELGTSLYIRPLIIGMDNTLGLKVSDTYRLMVITSPVSSYYEEGLNPIRIEVTTEYSRVVKGGLGNVKAAANYAASLYATQMAKIRGFSQVLWLDGKEHKYVDEVGTMNIMFVIDGTLVTPSLEDGTILPGITRDSVLKIARDWGWPVEERRIAFNEVIDAYKRGVLEEVFGTGTAAVISPVGELYYNGESMIVNEGKIGEKSQKLYDTITGIQHGKIEDKFGWITIIDD
ncbi:MAG: branched-chain amino acid aminotransferase [Candidatus Marinimicrobia bacterium]|nr:branched-chain amino acid aminotransferase [Candidatus Neomarinimicrobiota bacterium]MDD5582358.1 branched-chain amino acid aminotransferase [Candidatus Neomarinimicrobiota bacterium]